MNDAYISTILQCSYTSFLFHGLIFTNLRLLWFSYSFSNRLINLCNNIHFELMWFLYGPVQSESNICITWFILKRVVNMISIIEYERTIPIGVIKKVLSQRCKSLRVKIERITKSLNDIPKLQRVLNCKKCFIIALTARGNFVLVIQSHIIYFIAKAMLKIILFSLMAEMRVILL